MLKASAITKGYNKSLNKVSDLESQVGGLLGENNAAIGESLEKQVGLIKKKIQLGEEITPEELQVVEQFKIGKVKEKIKAGIDITPQEFDLVRNYVGKRKSNIQQDETGKYKLSLSDQDKQFRQLRGQIKPIENMPLGDGTTVLSRLITQVYGADGSEPGMREGKAIIMTPDGGTRELPDIDIAEAAKRFGISTLGQVGGAALGGLPAGKGLQVLGRIAGSGAGTGAAEALNTSNAIKAAQNLGLIQEGENIDNAIGSAALGGAVTGALGQGVFELPGAINPLAKFLKQEGNTGREIGQIKGTIAEQDLVEKLQRSVAGIPGKAESGIDAFGKAVKEIVDNAKNSLDASTNNLFTQFETEANKNIAKGRVKFIDMSKAYQAIVKNINKKVSGGTLTPEEGSRLIGFLESNFNGVKNEITNGARRVSPITQKLFNPTVAEVKPTAQIDLITGQPVMQTSEKTLTGFDPTKTTSLDLRRTINAIGEIYGDFNTAGQGALAELRSSLKQAMGDVSSKSTSDNAIANAIKLPAEELGKLRKAYTVAAKKYQVIPKEFLDLSSDALPSEYAKIAKTLPIENAKKLKNLVDQSPIEARTQFSQALKKDILTESRGVVRTRQKYADLSKLSPEDIANAKALSKEEVGSLMESNQPVGIENLKKAIIDSSEKKIPSEEGIVGNSLDNLLRNNPTQSLLLGKEGKQLANAAKELDRYQVAAGRVSSLQNAPNTALNQTGAIAQGLVEKVLPQGKGISQLLSSLINPSQRVAASVLESLPTEAVQEFTGSALGKGALGAGVGLIENPDLLEATNQKLKRLIGGVRFTEGIDRR